MRLTITDRVVGFDIEYTICGHEKDVSDHIDKLFTRYHPLGYMTHLKYKYVSEDGACVACVTRAQSTGD